VPSPTSSVQPDLPRPGRYRHFKGGEYVLLEVARHTETDELLVVYHSVEDPDTTWVRPVEMFNEIVERPDGTFRRFQPAWTWEEQQESGRLGRALRRAALALINRSGHGIGTRRSSSHPRMGTVDPKNPQDARIKGRTGRHRGVADFQRPLERSHEQPAPWGDTPAGSGVGA
jgi:Protein of unknown function (DUF1653)